MVIVSIKLMASPGRCGIRSRFALDLIAICMLLDDVATLARRIEIRLSI